MGFRGDSAELWQLDTVSPETEGRKYIKKWTRWTSACYDAAIPRVSLAEAHDWATAARILSGAAGSNHPCHRAGGCYGPNLPRK